MGLFHDIYHYVKRIVDYMNTISSFTNSDQEESMPFLLLNKETISAAKILKENIPLIPILPDCSQKTFKELNVSSMLELLRNKVPDLKTKIFNDSTKNSYNSFSLANTYIWSVECQGKSNEEKLIHDHWELIIDAFNRLLFFDLTTWEYCEIFVSSDQVKIDLHWKGAFERFEFLSPSSDLQPLWNLIYGSDHSLYQQKLTIHIFFLQILAKLAGIEFLPLTVHNNLFVSELKFNRVKQPHKSEIPQLNTKSFADFVYRFCYPSYVESSLNLEQNLQRELTDREVRFDQEWTDKKYIEQIQNWLRNLEGFREAYSKMIQEMK